jgi:hypothetical protein
MPITFTRAETVEPGEPIKSRQLASLAAAFNSRIRSGLGDATYRIPYYLFQAARQIRNSDGGTLFPPQGEFFEQYQSLRPQDGQWPVSFAGTPEGVNVSNPLGAFVFGNQSADIDNETDRIETVAFLVNGAAPATLADYWTLGQLQRGAIDPDTGGIASPALDAARLHMRIAYSVRSPYGNSYGGFQPIPEIGATPCDPADGFTPVNYEYKFTSLVDGSVVTYPGSCPEEPTNVGYILRLSDLYVVVLNNGDTDYYRRTEWVEGPYTGGGSLKRDVGGQLDRAVDQFTKDFRGTDAQRATGWNRHAFDFQRFLTRQYSLAPNRGQQAGNEITATYPTFTWTSNQASGTISGTGHAFAPGFVLDAVYIRAENVVASVTVEIIDDSNNVLATVSAVPTSGVAEAIHWLPSPATPTAIRARLASSLAFSGGSGRLTVQTTELYPYKPSGSDAYVLLRVASAKTGTVHGSGLEEEAAKEIWDGYSTFGCIVPGPGLPFEDATINSNAVYDAFRRMSQCVRILSRNQLIGYALEDGKSVLWFRRENTIGADTFAGIAPVNGVGGIAHTAPPRGFTNQWMMGFQLKAYHPSESSIWKPSAFSDYFTFSDRCHFYHPSYVSDLQQHFDYGATLSLAPEAAPGYRYAKGTNNDPGNVDRYKSCRIYDPDIEVESAEELTEGGVGVVKVTLTGRLHHADGAASSIARDVTTWNVTALRAEAYRSTENAIREYLVWANTGQNAIAGKPGDSAVFSGVDSLSDNPFGTVFPTIILTKLMPVPFLDGNSTQDAVDTPLVHDTLTQAELYLRAICEGYIDGRTSEEYACQSGISSWYDYTFQNLCFDAFRGQWLSPLASEQTPLTLEKDTRPDRPQAFGPWPNTLTSAEVWNQFANAVNLLTRVRVMLPMKFEAESRSDTYTGFQARNATNSLGTAANCSSPTGTGWSANVRVPTSIPTTVVSPRGIATNASAVNSAGYGVLSGVPSAPYVCSGAAHTFDQVAQQDDYWLDLVDPDAENAIPPDWRGQFNADGETLFTVTTTRHFDRATVVAAGAGSSCGPSPSRYPLPSGQEWLVESIEEVTSTCEILPMQGTVEMPDLGSVNMYGSQSLAGASCTSPTDESRTVEPVTLDAFMFPVALVDFEGE